MKKALIITGSFLTGVTEKGKIQNVARVGDNEVAVISNITLKTHGFQLTAREVEFVVERSLKDYDQIFIYADSGVQRLPVRNTALWEIERRKVILVRHHDLTDRDLGQILPHIGFNLPQEKGGEVQIIEAPKGDENGEAIMIAIRQAFLENGREGIGEMIKLLWEKAPPL